MLDWVLMTRALSVALREVRSYLQDKADLGFSLLLPVAIFALMYGAFGGPGQFHGTASVVNEDDGAFAASFLERLRAIDSLDVQLLAAATAETKLERSDLLLVTYIPAGFSSSIAAGQPVQLVFKQRGNGGTDGQIVSSIVRGVAEQMNRELQVAGRVEDLVVGTRISAGEIEVTVQRFIARERDAPLVRVVETTEGSRPDPVNQFLPGIITMFVLFAISLSAQVIVDERKKGTLERLLTTRLTRGELFAGKFVSGLLRGFVQTLILLALSYVVFHLFTPLSFLQVVVVAFTFAAAASAIGLLIAAVSRTPDQATWISVVFTNASVMLGGTFFAVPESGVFATISKFSINKYVNEALTGLISGGKSLSAVGSDIAIIAGVAVVALVLSRLLFRPVPGGGR
jgi:ABC-2 type transport system permease protein